jgi:hypothetical protein
MKLQINLDTDVFDVSISQDGELSTTRDARMMSALMSQTFPSLMKSVEEAHARMRELEEASKAKKPVEEATAE